MRLKQAGDPDFITYHNRMMKHAEIISNPINMNSLSDFKVYNYLETENIGKQIVKV